MAVNSGFQVQNASEHVQLDVELLRSRLAEAEATQLTDGDSDAEVPRFSMDFCLDVRLFVITA